VSYTPPIPSNFITTVVPVTFPDRATAPLQTSGNAAWKYGGWTQVVGPNVLTKHAFSGFIINGASGNYFQVDIGTGAAGSETVLFTCKVVISVTGSFLVMAMPLRVIPANARVATRLAAAGASQQVTLACHLYPLPL
jgi:hypothetical protein